MFPVLRGMDRKMDQLRWGLVPFWAKDLKGGARMINARSETVATKLPFAAPSKSDVVWFLPMAILNGSKWEKESSRIGFA